jgi:hypothetical protein
MSDYRIVYVIVADSWNGVNSVQTAVIIFNSKKKADEYAAFHNKHQSSSYDTNYYVEEIQFCEDED